MPESTIEKEIQEQISSLPAEKQKKVLEFAKALSKTKTNGISRHSILTFAGTIPPEDLALIDKAIKNGCEEVDLGEW